MAAGSLISLFTISPSGDNYILNWYYLTMFLMMAISGKQPLGTLLVQAGKIDEDQLQKALQIQKEKDVYIGQIFKELDYIDNKELNKYIGNQLKIPFIQLGYFDFDKTFDGPFS